MTFIKRYWPAGIVLIIVISLLFNFTTGSREEVLEQKENPLITEAEPAGDDETEAAEGDLIVDVKGEVNAPGIYEGRPGMRVYDAVEMAGGFTDQADEASVNLAQKLEDEMVILVTVVTGTEGGAGLAVSEQGDKVKINYATVDEITTINGIGPSKAEAIVAYREENGMFRKTEELLEVRGIGEKTLENMEEYILIP
ncbi:MULTISPECIES: helix-hairpin-helix domain-containing protein [Salimicrobium]|uniref:Competence protein ComEA n=3 Tax=Salimicrobium TaxID=351195 RepID=K2GD93_9BACI|nr:MULTISPECIES: helix-hairpin-helix domain-containing protein [Salimicrobium]AKG04264.1 competence protein ComEA [Salimicrobium jeotgali]EKE32232.1 late competence protein [Salimicrobium jeotgali]MBM7695843.1 competence protein ComEA [Salimicrobium jeotgali]SDX67424.1 competence protein ComEA [Salimicrobium album]SIS52129.1 competence protein ComEA [Salimicrobium salexigens]